MNRCFLSCDWGTTSFRLRLVDIDSGKIINELSTSQGITSVYAQWVEAGKIENDRLKFYLAIIRQQCKNIAANTGINTDDLPIIISGMASSSIGMLELPYTQMPFSVSGNDLQIDQVNKTSSFPNDVVIISGAKTNEDVMRGEETQLVGCANTDNKSKRMFIFPGTHSKHITVANGLAISVETYMTGELFELLTTKSILSASVEAGGDINDEEIKKAFTGGISESTKQNLLHSSFLTRTNQLFEKYSRKENYFYLSGLLIGTELNQLLKKEVTCIILVGDKKLQANYLLALKLLNSNVDIQIADVASATVKGQLAVYNRLYK